MKYIIASLLIVVIGIIVYAMVRKPRLVDKSLATFHGHIRDYHGDKRLVVAFTASWASVWIATCEELRKLDRDKFDLCILDGAVDSDEISQWGVRFFPTVALVQDGEIIDQVQNLTNIDQLADW